MWVDDDSFGVVELRITHSMQIFWKGQSYVQIIAARTKQEQVRIVMNPFTDPSSRKAPLEADIALVGCDDPAFHNVRELKGTPFIIQIPGEYEVKDVFIYGIPATGTDPKKRTVIYTVEAEGMHLCHLGGVGQKELTADQVERIGNVDILFIPVGEGAFGLETKVAAHMVEQIEPRMVVPLQQGKGKGAEELAKTLGQKIEEVQQKLTIKMRDLPSEGMAVALLEPA